MACPTSSPDGYFEGTIVIDPIAAVNELYGVNMMTNMWLNGGFSESAGAPRDANGELLKDAHSGDATTSKDVVAPDHPPSNDLSVHWSALLVMPS